jgi:hypothetical protein
MIANASNKHAWDLKIGSGQEKNLSKNHTVILGFK